MRWRPFLNEVGDQAGGTLQRAQQHESEFDVRVEMLAAIERIEGRGVRLKCLCGCASPRVLGSRIYEQSYRVQGLL